VHICYGYGIRANTDWKGTLGSEWRQYERIFPALAKSRIGQVSLECAGSRVPIELLSLLDGKDLMVGVIDVASTAVETPQAVADTIRKALKVAAPEHVYPCTNCGMVPLARDVAYGKLKALAAGAAIVRAELEKRRAQKGAPSRAKAGPTRKAAGGRGAGRKSAARSRNAPRAKRRA
jgi:5-methyltetrahydropteroyltriglutamate--homocysteine methyltransferase